MQSAPSDSKMAVLWDGLGHVVKRVETVIGNDAAKLRLISVTPGLGLLYRTLAGRAHGQRGHMGTQAYGYSGRRDVARRQMQNLWLHTGTDHDTLSQNATERLDVTPENADGSTEFPELMARGGQRPQETAELLAVSVRTY